MAVAIVMPVFVMAVVHVTDGHEDVVVGMAGVVVVMVVGVESSDCHVIAQVAIQA